MVSIAVVRPRFARLIKRNRDQIGTIVTFFNLSCRIRHDSPFHKFTKLIFLGLVLLLANQGIASAGTNTPSQQSGTDAGIIKIVAFGDSLTAGYQLRPRYAFPAQLGKALKARGHNVMVANAGVSGDTTAAGLARLDWAVPAGTDAVILELGANDALRGLDPNAARKNLDTIVTILRSRNIEVLIAGVPSPSNFGHYYRETFGTMFTDIAARHHILEYRNFLNGIVMKPDLNLSDGLHPNPKGVSVIVTNILPSVEKLIANVKARRLARAK